MQQNCQIIRPIKCKNYKKQKKGFTLAEILLTLTIIGLIASWTIPDLILNIKNAQSTAALKKNYSAIAQAYKSLQADGVEITAAFPGTDTGAAALNILTTKLNIAKKCGSGMGCMYNTPLYWLNTTNIEEATPDTEWNGTYGKAMFADGTMFFLWDHQNNCTSTKGTGVLANSICGELYIDVNGSKGPNTIGRDFFGFWIARTGIYPFGSNNDWAVGDCLGPPYAGWSCPTIVMTQGMNY